MGKARAKATFEYCEVCRLNQNEGRGHRYLPRHVRALSTLLSNFLLKIRPLRASLRQPSFLPTHTLWCPFCSSDVTPSPSSSFHWEDPIYHLSGAEHLRNLKTFFWRHGGKMDKIDSFLVSQEDLLKWEKKCEILMASKELSNGSSQGLTDAMTKDIQNQFTSRHVSFENEMPTFLDRKNDCGVMPLQNHTNERCRQSCFEVGGFGSSSGHSTVTLANIHFGKNVFVAVNSGEQPALLENGQGVVSISSSKMDEASVGRREINGGHFDASPLQGMIGDQSANMEMKTTCFNALSTPFSGQAKFNKLNPNRVGAAWAEKRRYELEMEKKGVIITHYDPNWLPDFGRVWQAGTRKQSRKEFLTETKKMEGDTVLKASVAVYPYMSKRMRLESQEGDADPN